MKNFSLILAVDDKNWLWKNGDLAWRLPEDMKYFKNITTSSDCENSQNAVIMGRKTWDSIPERFRPLPDRMNCILSSSYEKNAEKIDTNSYGFNSLQACLEFLSQRKDIEKTFVIGGSHLYNMTLTHLKLEKIYLTQISGNFDCDVFFNGVPDTFKLESKTKSKLHKDIEYKFLVFRKKSGIFTKIKRLFS